MDGGTEFCGIDHSEVTWMNILDPARLQTSDAYCSTENVEESGHWKCPTCNVDVHHVAGFSAAMNLPGEETLKAKGPVRVLKIEDGRVAFKSNQRTRI